MSTSTTKDCVQRTTQGVRSAQCAHRVTQYHPGSHRIVTTRLVVGATERPALLRPLHEEQSRQNLEEQSLDPGRHDVSRRRPEVNVDDENRQHYRHGHERHHEQQVLNDNDNGNDN